MLGLLDVMAPAGVVLQDFKIHFAQYVQGSPPLDAFFAGHFKEWQEDQGKRNFPCRQILSLIHLGADRWLFAGVYEVNGEPRKTDDGYRYSTSEVRGLDDLVGRVVVAYRKEERSCYRRGPDLIDRLVVSEILPERMSVGDFPGYRCVDVTFAKLQMIVRQQVPSWKAALSSVGGVYVIVDTKTGKMYVGSAYGSGGLWERWRSYAETGHAGNQELRALLAKEGAGYAGNFQFGVLETCDLSADKDQVMQREAHWKDLLLTREFGFNKN